MKNKTNYNAKLFLRGVCEMRTILFTFCLMLFCNFAFADVGPLTAATQKFFAETGQCYIKYYDYSQAKAMQSAMQGNPKMMGGLFGNPFKVKTKNGKLQPSNLFEFTKSEEGEANKRDGLNQFKSRYMPATWNIVKNEKYYILNTSIKATPSGTVLLPTNKIGLRKDLKDCTESELANVGLNALPTALAIVLPDTLLPSGNNKFLVKKYAYDGTFIVEIDGTSYQCEQYSLGSIPTDKLSPFGNSADVKMIIKLFYKEGRLVKFEDRGIQYDVEADNKLNKDLITIPQGYTIYADTRHGMEGLLEKEVVLEKY